MEREELRNIYGRLRICQCDCPGLNEGKTIESKPLSLALNCVGDNELQMAILKSETIFRCQKAECFCCLKI